MKEVVRVWVRHPKTELPHGRGGDIRLRAWEYRTLSAFLGDNRRAGKLDFLSCHSLKDSMNRKHRLEPDGLGLTLALLLNNSVTVSKLLLVSLCLSFPYLLNVD